MNQARDIYNYIHQFPVIRILLKKVLQLSFFTLSFLFLRKDFKLHHDARIIYFLQYSFIVFTIKAVWRTYLLTKTKPSMKSITNHSNFTKSKFHLFLHPGYFLKEYSILTLSSTPVPHPSLPPPCVQNAPRENRLLFSMSIHLSRVVRAGYGPLP